MYKQVEASGGVLPDPDPNPNPNPSLVKQGFPDPVPSLARNPRPRLGQVNRVPYQVGVNHHPYNGLFCCHIHYNYK